MAKSLLQPIKKASFVIALVVILGVSCSDDPEPSRTDLLTANSWKIDERISQGQFQTIEGCVFDSGWEYKRDNSLKLHSGETKCNPEEPEVTNGTWKFINNETVIELQMPGVLLEREIIELSKGVLRVRTEFGVIIKYEDADN